jgi:peptidoglycan/xylan/chitin deacetylase (PgdA/CDA1 family)
MIKIKRNFKKDKLNTGKTDEGLSINQLEWRNMRLRLWSISFMICIVAISFAAMGQSPGRPMVVNIMIDAELSPFAQNASSQEKENAEIGSLLKMLDEIDSRGLNTTVYFTGDFISKRTENTSYEDLAILISSKPNHELAMHSMKTGEKLGLLSYEEQLSLLTETMGLLEGTYIRDGQPQKVKGFRPQYFSQNESTYKILDEMGIEYNSGYQAGLLYAPGHENDTWPYMVENYTFYAVPISTHRIEGKLTYICDLCSMQSVGLDGQQWSDLLIDEFDEGAKRGDPVVVLFHNFVSGKDEEYMDAFVRFLDYIVAENVVSLTTADLVEMAKRDRSISGNSSSTGGIESLNQPLAA